MVQISSSLITAIAIFSIVTPSVAYRPYRHPAPNAQRDMALEARWWVYLLFARIVWYELLTHHAEHIG